MPPRCSHHPDVPSLEGPVSRYLNRPLSRPLARILAPTPLTPNAVSVIACGIAFGALALLAAGRNIEAGVLVQASSVVDGVDGDLARVKGMATRFGGVFDAVLDRFADAAIIGGMGWWALAHEDKPGALVLAFAALVGAVLVSYSRARIEGAFGATAAAGVLGIASRDVRLLALAVGAVAGQCWVALAVVAAASHATLAWRLIVLRARPDAT